MSAYATVEDMAALWRPLTQPEQDRAEQLLEIISESLRAEARRVGRDLDGMLSACPELISVARSVAVDVAARTLMTATDQEPMSQFTQTAGPFSASGTFLIPGGGLFIKRSELARLGLRRQRYGGMELYGTFEGQDGGPV